MKKLLKGLGSLFYNIRHFKQSFKANKVSKERKSFKGILNGIFHSKGRIFSNDADFEIICNKAMELKKQKELSDEIKSIDLDKVDILDYVSLYLSDLNISSEKLKNIYSIVENITKDNSNEEIAVRKNIKLREKLKEIVNITGFAKYNSLMNILENFDDIEDERIDVINNIDDVDGIIDYVSLYLSDLNISSGALENIYSIIKNKIKDNPDKRIELCEKLKEIANITGDDKYNRLMDIFEELDNIEEEQIDDINNDDINNKVSNILESLKQSKIESEEIIASYTEEIEKSKAKLNNPSKDVFNEMNDEIEETREDWLISKYKDAYERGLLSFEEYKRFLIENRKSKSETCSDITEANPSVSETINTNNSDKQIIDSKIIDIKGSSHEKVEKNLTKQDYWNDYKSNKITAKELVDACDKIDEKNQEQYDKKCENEYKLYQERMTEILELTSKINTLKSKIYNMGDVRFINDDKKLKKYGKRLRKLRKLETMLDALSTRIVVLEKRGYAREYELKLEQEREDYIEYWEKALSEEENKEENMKHVNIELLEAFTDEEIGAIVKNGLNDSEVEAIMKFKNIMK